MAKKTPIHIESFGEDESAISGDYIISTDILDKSIDEELDEIENLIDDINSMIKDLRIKLMEKK